jgi:hypothetical protein
MTNERDGVERRAKIDAAKAKDAAKEEQPRASAASEPAKRQARARVGEFEGRSSSEK